MPFRARMKRAFTRSSSSSGSSNASSSLSKTESRGIGDPKIYQPGEAMPRPKYRAPVDKKHKAKLEAFTFGTSTRRKSVGSNSSLYSPMGSKLPSRNNSVHRPAWYSRNNSHFAQLSEAADDEGDVGNVGGASKRHSKDGHMDTRGSSIAKPQVEHMEIAPQSGTASDHTPFSMAELNTALHKSTSRPPLETL